MSKYKEYAEEQTEFLALNGDMDLSSFWAADLRSANLVALALRRHWTIGNGLLWVPDVSYNEDRLHALLLPFCHSFGTRPSI